MFFAAGSTACLSRLAHPVLQQAMPPNMLNRHTMLQWDVPGSEAGRHFVHGPKEGDRCKGFTSLGGGLGTLIHVKIHYCVSNAAFLPGRLAHHSDEHSMPQDDIIEALVFGIQPSAMLHSIQPLFVPSLDRESISASIPPPPFRRSRTDAKAAARLLPSVVFSRTVDDCDTDGLGFRLPRGDGAGRSGDGGGSLARHTPSRRRALRRQS